MPYCTHLFHDANKSETAITFFFAVTLFECTLSSGQYFVPLCLFRRSIFLFKGVVTIFVGLSSDFWRPCELEKDPHPRVEESKNRLE